MDGEKRSMTCFKMIVGRGSAAEDLSGSRRTALMTSSVVCIANAGNDTYVSAHMAERRWWRSPSLRANLSDLVGEKLIESFDVNGGTRWYSSTTQQNVYELPLN